MIVTSLLLASLTRWADRADDPYEILSRVIGPPAKESVIAITTLESGSNRLVYKMTYIKDKAHKGEILHPLMYQGNSYLDNGKEMRYYDSGKRWLIVTESQEASRLSVEKRMVLIRQNYSVKITDRLEMLGREAYEISLKANHKELGERKLLVDQGSGFLFKYTVTYPNQKVRVLSQVLSLSKTDKTELSLDTVPGVRLIKPWGPFPVQDIKHATGIVGFRPVTPTKLPKGFKLYSQRIVGEEDEPVLESNVSDGMVRLSIYQWSKSHGQRAMHDEVSFDYDQGDVYCAVRGYIPQAVEIELARAFRPTKSDRPERPQTP